MTPGNIPCHNQRPFMQLTKSLQLLCNLRHIYRLSATGYCTHVMQSPTFQLVDICNYICLDTSYHFWLYFYCLNILSFFSSTPVLTYSIDVVFLLSIMVNTKLEIVFPNITPPYSLTSIHRANLGKMHGCLFMSKMFILYTIYILW